MINTFSGVVANRLYLPYEKYLFRRNCRKADSALVSRHPEWESLTAEERAQTDKKELAACVAYKNMYGSGENIRYFVPDAFYKTELLPKLNPLNHLSSGRDLDSEFSDKNYAELLMPEMPFPAVILRRAGGRFFSPDMTPISRGEALALLESHDCLVFKQSLETGHGTGIEKLSRAEYAEKLDSFSDDFLVQPVVRQHENLSYFNASSVNIVRITSLYWQEKVYILGAILRVGAPGSFFDHCGANGLNYVNLPVREDGTVLNKVMDIDNGILYPDIFGKPVQGSVPGFEKMKQLIIQAHTRWPNYRIIGWDMTADENGKPVCMEFNTKWPGLTGTQYCCGPVMGQLSERGTPLLDEILNCT